MKIKEKVLVWIMAFIMGAVGSAAVTVPVSIIVPQKIVEKYIPEDKEEEEIKMTLEQRQQKEIIDLVESGFFMDLWNRLISQEGGKKRSNHDVLLKNFYSEEKYVKYISEARVEFTGKGSGSSFGGHKSTITFVAKTIRDSIDIFIMEIMGDPIYDEKDRKELGLPENSFKQKTADELRDIWGI